MGGEKESRGDGTSECSTGVPTTRSVFVPSVCTWHLNLLYVYIYIHVSPPLCVISVYLLPSVYASIPFDPFFFLFIAVPLYPSSSTLFPFCSPLSMIISLAFFPSCCVYTPVVHVCFSLSPFLPLLFFFLLSADGFCGPSRRDRRRYRYRYRTRGLCLFWRATLWKIVRREGIRSLVKVEEDLLNRSIIILNASRVWFL